MNHGENKRFREFRTNFEIIMGARVSRRAERFFLVLTLYKLVGSYVTLGRETHIIVRLRVLSTEPGISLTGNRLQVLQVVKVQI